MPCTFCETPLPARARYCYQCGTAVEGAAGADEGVDWKGSDGEGMVRAGWGGASSATSTTAVVSLVMGILSWTFLPILGAVASVIAGHRARDEIRGSRGLMQGGALAMAGLFLGYIQLIPLILILGVVILVGLAAMAVGLVAIAPFAAAIP